MSDEQWFDIETALPPDPAHHRVKFGPVKLLVNGSEVIATWQQVYCDSCDAWAWLTEGGATLGYFDPSHWRPLAPREYNLGRGIVAGSLRDTPVTRAAALMLSTLNAWITRGGDQRLLEFSPAALGAICEFMAAMNQEFRKPLARRGVK